MKNIHSIEFHKESKEERLPDFAPEFPYIASRVDLDQYAGGFVPWHWHREVELFYVESGKLEYHTPKGKKAFFAGSGGLVNSNVLHMTREGEKAGPTVQLLHIFDLCLIGGNQGSRIAQKYIIPFLANPQLEIIALSPLVPGHADLLEKIRRSFCLFEEEFGYEIKLRSILSDIWCELLKLARPFLKEKGDYDKTNDKIKSMMLYIHEHYMDKISIADIAAAAFISERECYRAFHDCLHVTPVDYLRIYRLEKACRLLACGGKPVTDISQACGLGSSSYFAKVFHENMGMTPSQYRKKWQDSDTFRPE